jgi:glycerol-3-phosphate acyltransferase PlsY
MIREYKKKTAIAAAVCLCSLVAIVVMLPPAGSGGAWDEPGRIATLPLVICIGAYFYAFWACAKGKGYPGVLGLLLPLLSVVGLIVVIVLKDKNRSPSP